MICEANISSNSVDDISIKEVFSQIVQVLQVQLHFSKFHQQVSDWFLFQF